MSKSSRAQVEMSARYGATVLAFVVVSAHALALLAAIALGFVGGVLTPTGPDTYPDASTYRAVQHHYLWLLATALIAALALAMSAVASSNKLGFTAAAVCTVAGLVLMLYFAPDWPNKVFIVGAGAGCVISLAPPIIRVIDRRRRVSAFAS